MTGYEKKSVPGGLRDRTAVTGPKPRIKPAGEESIYTEDAF